MQSLKLSHRVPRDAYSVCPARSECPSTYRRFYNGENRYPACRLPVGDSIIIILYRRVACVIPKDAARVGALRSCSMMTMMTVGVAQSRVIRCRRNERPRANPLDGTDVTGIPLSGSTRFLGKKKKKKKKQKPANQSGCATAYPRRFVCFVFR